MKAYFYIDSNNVQKGPVAGERLTEFGVTAETPVWCDGMSDWMPAETVDELKPLFQQPPWQQFGQQQYAGSQSYQQQPNYGRYQQPYNQSRQYGYNPQQPVPEKPDNWLAWSILCTILCCLPFGVVGIVYVEHQQHRYDQHYRHEQRVHETPAGLAAEHYPHGVCRQTDTHAEVNGISEKLIHSLFLLSPANHILRDEARHAHHHHRANHGHHYIGRPVAGYVAPRVNQPHSCRYEHDGHHCYKERAHLAHVRHLHPLHLQGHKQRRDAIYARGDGQRQQAVEHLAQK